MPTSTNPGRSPLQMLSPAEFFSLDREAQVQIEVAEYLYQNYPSVMFHSDFGTGVRLRPKQYKIQSAQNAGRRGWPDMVITAKRTLLVPAKNGSIKPAHYGALFLELKAEGVKLQKKNGEWKTPHIVEQAEVLERLRNHGFMAEFAVGFEEAKQIIDNYLGETK